jgi:hypothetical protein
MQIIGSKPGYPPNSIDDSHTVFVCNFELGMIPEVKNPNRGLEVPIPPKSRFEEENAGLVSHLGMKAR